MFPSRLVRTSNRPLPNPSTRGLPTGHRRWTLLDVRADFQTDFLRQRLEPLSDGLLAHGRPVETAIESGFPDGRHWNSPKQCAKKSTENQRRSPLPGGRFHWLGLLVRHTATERTRAFIPSSRVARSASDRRS